MIWLSDYLKNKYGYAPKKISIDAGFTCPNRDGTYGYGGCIFCSQDGSGDFTKGPGFSVSEQIEMGKVCGENKKYIAYFQAYTNTYGDIKKMRDMYMSVVARDDIEIVSIATRPDCLGAEVIELLKDISRIKPVWIELGLQTVQEDTSKYIRRGYGLDVYDSAVKSLYEAGVAQIITHVILGLPKETQLMMLETVKHVGDLAKEYGDGNTEFGIKLQLLHVLKGTDLAGDYAKGKFTCLTFEEYVDTVVKCLKIIPDNMIVHRITGDGDKSKLIAPLWSVDKKKVMNAIKQKFNSQSDEDNLAMEEAYNNYLIHERLFGNNETDVLSVFLYGTSKTVPGDSKKLFDEICKVSNKEFVLVAYNVSDWNNDFSPWKADCADVGSFAGCGEITKDFILNDLIPEIKQKYERQCKDIKIVNVGYSLAGLFSLWAYYELRPLIDGVICCSGSLWFPGFDEYIEKVSEIGSNYISKADILYLSLGGKESSSGNPIMDRVGEITKRQYEIAKMDKSISKCRYDVNKGGHFADPVKRMVKGIGWYLSVI